MGVRNRKREELRRLAGKCHAHRVSDGPPRGRGRPAAPGGRLEGLAPASHSGSLSGGAQPGALLTREDLAYRVFFCHPVTISRDLALKGKTTSQIGAILHHSPAAAPNSLWTFARCAYLAREGIGAGQIAFLLRRAEGESSV